MNLSQLQAKLRNIARKELSRRGSALLAGRKRRHSSRRKSGSALLAGKRSRHSSRRHSSRRKSSRRMDTGSALLAGRRKSTRRHSYKRHHTIGTRSASGRRHRSHSRRHYSGKAMLAGKRRGNHKGKMALTKINAIARELKRQHPHIEHKQAISQASQMYRSGHTGSAMHRRRHSRRHSRIY